MEPGALFVPVIGVYGLNGVGVMPTILVSVNGLIGLIGDGDAPVPPENTGGLP